MTRILVISDVHSNLPALEAVLADAERHGSFDFKLNAGDIVGYGPWPNECITMLTANGFNSTNTVRGNHDSAVLTGDTVAFNLDARDAARYNQSVLTYESRGYLVGLKSEPLIEKDGKFAMTHGSFAGSGNHFEDKYIFEEHDAVQAMSALCFDDDSSETGWKHSPLGIVGHTHLPIYASCWAGYPEGLGNSKFEIYLANKEKLKDKLPRITQVEFGNRPEQGVYDILWMPKSLINPGSVGQPRDGDPRASYGIITIKDDGKMVFEYHKVEYPICNTQAEMRKIGHSNNIGFSQSLVDRLALGK